MEERTICQPSIISVDVIPTEELFMSICPVSIVTNFRRRKQL